MRARGIERCHSADIGTANEGFVPGAAEHQDAKRVVSGKAEYAPLQSRNARGIQDIELALIGDGECRNAARDAALLDAEVDSLH